MWLANKFPSVKRLIRENAALRQRLAEPHGSAGTSDAPPDGSGNGHLPYTNRPEYKKVWAGLSSSLEQATISVYGSTDERSLRESARWTYEQLCETVGIGAEDRALEIGCGIGRVGEELSPHCLEWVGADVSANMLGHAARRLFGRPNVRFVEVSGYDLSPIESESVDVAYCTIVFMHLSTWDRFAYVREAHRVLRPGGRFFVDNLSLCTEWGWHEFEKHAAIPPSRRPAHIGEFSTPQELEIYLLRAGFRDVQTRTRLSWVQAWARK
jgi:SAM-dependent methyltransferase